MSHLLIILGLMVSLSLSHKVSAEQISPMNTQLMSEFQKYFTESGQPSEEKIDALLMKMKKIRGEVHQLIVDYRTKKEGKKLEKSIEKANNKVVNYDYAIAVLEQLKITKNMVEFEKLAIEFLELEYSLKVEGNPLLSVWIRNYIKASAKSYGIYKNKTPKGEASNLYNPATGKYYTTKELDDLKVRGKDVSRLNPGPKSTFMDLDIETENVDMKKTHLGQLSIYNDMNIEWPDETVELDYDEVRKTQSKPKIYVKAKNSQGKKETYKLKLGEELHSEPTTAALASALGIYTDLSVYRQKIKMNLGETSYKEFRKEFNSYFNTWDLEQYIIKKGTNNKGEDYIVFEDGMLEHKLKKQEVLKRVGPWAWGSVGHQGSREARGLFLFNVWVSNIDLKEAENNKLLTRETKSGTRIIHMQHDMGFGFGNFLREKPLNYKWDIVKRETSSRVVFNFRNIQDNSGFDHITWADARWMIRKIARLSKSQIADAVKVGGWPSKNPYDIQTLLVEKLVKRRNDLVKTFGLLGERFANGKKITLLERASQKRVDIDSIPKKLPGYSLDFSTEAHEMKHMIFSGIKNTVIDQAINALGSVKKISIDGVDLGIDDGIIAQLIFNVNRTITKNPNPETDRDNYLVRDDFTIGARLGYGLVVSGDVALVRKYSLIYPVRTVEEGRHAGNTVVDLRLPYKFVNHFLPDNHIAIREDYIQTRGRVKLVTGAVGPGFSVARSRYNLGRTILSQKHDNKLTVFQDYSKFNENEVKVFLQIVIAKINGYVANTRKGTTTRDVFKFSIKDHRSQKALDAVSKAFLVDDFKSVEKISPKERITNQFETKQRRFSLLGFLGSEKSSRFDDIEVKELSSSGHVRDIHYRLNLSRGKESSWRFFENGESTDSEVRLMTSLDESSSKLVDPVVKIQYIKSDNNVKSKELKDEYLPFLNCVSGNSKFLQWSPELHTVNHLWGSMNVEFNIELYEKGLLRMLRLTPAQMQSKFAKYLGLSESQLEAKFRKLNAPRTRIGRKGPGRSTRRVSGKVKCAGAKYSLNTTLTGAEKFLKNMTKAAQEKDLKEKLEKIIKAIEEGIRPEKRSFSPVMANFISYLTGKDQYYMEGSIYHAVDEENKWPERVIPYNNIGKKQFAQKEQSIFEAQDAIELYQSF